MDAAAVVMAMMVALAVDMALGEPASRWHPVVGMGQLLDRLATLAGGAPARGKPARPVRAFVVGAGCWLVAIALVAGIAFAVAASIHAAMLPWLLTVLLSGLALKPLMAWRMLRDQVCAVESALGVDDDAVGDADRARSRLDAGRDRLRRLVSRDTSTLSVREVRESAVESLAENLNDSVVAPLFWFCILGLPGAAAYRLANTADAMWGYRDHREWFGKWAARADDLLSFAPARVTALLIAAQRPSALATLHRDARRTPSPNGGWPMAAMAHVLDVRLDKPGVYRLHPDGREIRGDDLLHAATIAGRALVVGLIASGLLAVIIDFTVVSPP